MTTVSIFRLINILLAALLAGASFGIWMGFNPENYSAATYLEQQVNLVQSLHTLMVTMVILATLTSLIVAYLQRHIKYVCISMIAAAGFFASCIFISRFGNLPIQTEMLSWRIDTIPDNWTVLRDKWWSLHIMRTIAELMALILVASTNVINYPASK